MDKKVSSTQGITALIEEYLKEYQDDLEETTDDVLNKAAKGCVTELKQTSPKQKKGQHAGRYAKGWRVQKDSSLKGICKISNYTVHNKTDYQLTHLLENGHVSKNQYGSYGRVAARPHIAKAEQTAVKKCLIDLEAKLR